MPDVKSPRELQIVDQVLTQIARQYRPTGFVYSQLAPTIQVDAESGRYPTYTKESFFGDASDSGDTTKVADRAETALVGLLGLVYARTEEEGRVLLQETLRAPTVRFLHPESPSLPGGEESRTEGTALFQFLAHSNLSV